MESYSMNELRKDFNRYIARLAHEYGVYYRAKHDAYNKTEKYSFSIYPNPWCTIVSIELDYGNAFDIFNKVYEGRKYLENKLKEYSNCKQLDLDAVCERYAINDALITSELSKYVGCDLNHTKIPHIENVIFNNPATIIFWKDGTKTVVKAQDGEAYDPEKGLAMAICKKALGNEGNYYEKLKPWLMDVICETEPTKHDICSNVANAYRTLKYGLVKSKITKAELIETIEEAADYLKEEFNI